LTSTLQEEPFDPKISTKLRYIGDILNVDTSAFFYDDFLCWRLLTKWMTFVYRLKGLKMYGTDREADIVQGVKRSGGYWCCLRVQLDAVCWLYHCDDLGDQ